MIKELITAEDRVALLRQSIVVISVRGRLVFVSAPDEKLARSAVEARAGSDVRVHVRGVTPRENRSQPCVGFMEREPRRLQLRYVIQGDQHVDQIWVEEDDETVVVFGTICMSVVEDPGELVECPYHVWLERSLGNRTVVDGFDGEPVPFKNVYDGIEERVAARAHGEWE